MNVDFSIQSMCKPFNYCFAMEKLGLEKVHQHVGQEPSGRQFDDLTLLARTAIGQALIDNPNGKSSRYLLTQWSTLVR